MTYVVTAFVPDACSSQWVLGERRIVGTRRAAELLADALLRPHARTETAYYARVRRGAFAQILNRRGEFVDQIEAPVHIVPSVGDLGWTP